MDTQQKTQPWYLYPLVFLLGCAILVISCYYLVCDRTPAGGVVTSPQGTLEHAIENIVRDEWGTTCNWDNSPAKLISIQKTMQVAGPDSGGYRVTIKYRADENWSADVIRESIGFDAIDFFKVLFSKPECAQVSICALEPYFLLSDQYGQQSEAQVATILIRRASAKKIDWSNMTPHRLSVLLQSEGIYRFYH